MSILFRGENQRLHTLKLSSTDSFGCKTVFAAGVVAVSCCVVFLSVEFIGDEERKGRVVVLSSRAVDDLSSLATARSRRFKRPSCETH